MHTTQKTRNERTIKKANQIQPQVEFRLNTLRISWSQLLDQSSKGFTGKGDFFEGQELYRNHLYRTLNRETWPETPINIKSVSENYFLDMLKIQIIP